MTASVSYSPLAVSAPSGGFTPGQCPFSSVRQGLVDALNAVTTDKQASYRRCAGRTFIAGADITEFGGRPSASTATAEALECTKLAVAAIHGTVGAD